MDIVAYEVVTSTTSQSVAQLQESVSRHGIRAHVEHSYWARCESGWRGLVFLGHEVAPTLCQGPCQEPAEGPAQGTGAALSGEDECAHFGEDECGQCGEDECARAIAAAFRAVSPDAVVTVVRADPPR